MQTTGDLVAAALLVELSARVERREHHLDSRLTRAFNDVDRDPSAVVGDPAPAVGQEFDDDAVTVAGHRFVNCVVDYLVHQMVESSDAGGSDVHPGAFANRIEALQNGDGLGVVTARHLGLRGGYRLLRRSNLLLSDATPAQRREESLSRRRTGLQRRAERGSRRVDSLALIITFTCPKSP